MGESSEKLKAIKKRSSVCIYCFGERPTETREHRPPRAMFQDKHVPVGFEFPACWKCNHGSSDDDLIVSIFARLDPFEETGDSDGRLMGLLARFRRTFPGLLDEMFPTAIDARRINRRLGIQPSPGLTHQQAGPLIIPARVFEAIEKFALKLAKSIFFLETGQPIPREAETLVSSSTNAALVKLGKYPELDILRTFPGVAPVLSRNNKSLNDQFQYRWSITEDNDMFALTAVFARSFMLVVFGALGGMERSNTWSEMKSRANSSTSKFMSLNVKTGH